MPVLKRSLYVPPSQLDGLRSAMLDLQVSIGNYYRQTEGFGVTADVLATPVRTCVGFVQVLNELLRKQMSHSGEYRDMFDAPEDPRVGVIRAFEYVRHVTQHVLPVRPGPTSTVGGLGLGFRTYAVWQEVSASVHNRLKRDTQKLKPYYDKYLAAQEVVGTMLDAARFFSEVCPDLVHHQPNGEWTGFPLRHQAGVTSRLHPEEPVPHAAALAWMASRRPGGDLRVICGNLVGDDDNEVILFGLTFTQQCALVPFFETCAQIDADIALRFDYYEADVAANTSECSARFGLSDSGRSVMCSERPVNEWAGDSLVTAPRRGEHATFGSVEDWRQMWWQESMPNPQAFITRRERRLNASLPYH